MPNVVRYTDIGLGGHPGGCCCPPTNAQDGSPNVFANNLMVHLDGGDMAAHGCPEPCADHPTHSRVSQAGTCKHVLVNNKIPIVLGDSVVDPVSPLPYGSYSSNVFMD